MVNVNNRIRLLCGEEYGIYTVSYTHLVIEPKYQQYEQVMSLADGEISKILMENRNVDSSMKIFQRSITKYLQQQR